MQEHFVCFVFFLLVGRTLQRSEHPEHSELWMNSCSLPDYYRMSEPDKIFLGWRETQAEGTAGGRIYKAKNTCAHTLARGKQNTK